MAVSPYHSTSAEATFIFIILPINLLCYTASPFHFPQSSAGVLIPPVAGCLEECISFFPIYRARALNKQDSDISLYDVGQSHGAWSLCNLLSFDLCGSCFIHRISAPNCLLIDLNFTNKRSQLSWRQIKYLYLLLRRNLQSQIYETVNQIYETVLDQ